MNYITNDTPVKVLELSVRSYNALIMNGVDTVEKLIRIPIEELWKIRNLGVKSINEICDTINTLKNGNNRLALSEVKPSKPARLFYDLYGILRIDIPIEDLGLSVRANNCLKQNGISYASEMMNLTEETLSSFQHMGVKTVHEVLDKIKGIRFEESPSSEENSYTSFSDEMFPAFETEMQKNLLIETEALRSVFLQVVKPYLAENEINADLQICLHDLHLIKLIYSHSFIRTAIRAKVNQALLRAPFGLSYTAFELLLPEHLNGTDVISEVLNEMQTSGEILFTEHGVEKHYPSILEYAQQIADKRAQILLMGRLNGETLEELGQKNGLTRERIRQIVAKLIKRRPRLMEDRYVKVFEKYSFEKQDFIIIFEEPASTYNYLNLVYSKGTTPIEELMEDVDLPLRFKKAVEKVVFKDYISVDGERVRISKPDIAFYIVKTFFKDEAPYDDFVIMYQLFLEEHNLDSKFTLDERSYQNKLNSCDYALWKQNRRLRFYNFAEYDFDELLKTLAFEQYSNVEYSALKFFRDYPELMRTYDIRDEYELHNLLKKLNRDVDERIINFRRMPTIEFGTANRDEQALELLLQYAPVTLNDLADIYEREYGVRSETVKANYLKSFDQYLYNGLYTIDSKPLPNEVFKRMSQVLTEDFYSIADIKRIYLREFPAHEVSAINAFTIKTLGFRVYSSYVIKNTYPNAVEYFRQVLTGSDIVDLQELPKEMVQHVSFNFELAQLRNRYEIIDFSASKLINIRRLNSIGITKEHFLDYCDSVFSAVERGSFFTIYSLKNKGFLHSLDSLGFDEWFYSSILIKDNNRFSYRRMGKTRVLFTGKSEVTLKDFIESLVSELQSIDIYDLVTMMEEDYGVVVDKQKVMDIVNSSSMYYNSIMEKVYIDYDTYFEEV